MASLIPPNGSAQGLARLLVQETSVSDLVQWLTELDPSPWAGLVGFVPMSVDREVAGKNKADIQLIDPGNHSVHLFELKVGHHLSDDQRWRYEALADVEQLWLVGLAKDESVVADYRPTWKFLALARLFKAWCASSNPSAAAFASSATEVFEGWDQVIQGAFRRMGEPRAVPLKAVQPTSLVRVLLRDVAQRVRGGGEDAWAGNTNGGDNPIIQAWRAVTEGAADKSYFMVDIRWRSLTGLAELRFGVEVDVSPKDETREDRARAFSLAMAMESVLDAEALREKVQETLPCLGGAIRLPSASRPMPKGDWKEVVEHGFPRLAQIQGKKRLTRSQIAPGFYGDGTLRHQAMATLDLAAVTGADLEDLICATLDHLEAAYRRLS